MCGIVGILGVNSEFIEKASSAIKHRGPDEQKYKIFNNNISLGMARLSIIDLKSKGLCLYHEKNYVLTYNGEIYNYKEIRRELKHKGIKFNTNCDTEVFLKSFIFWGKNCFSKFNGMFAAGIYDLKKKKLYLVRDIANMSIPQYKHKEKFTIISDNNFVHSTCFECKTAAPEFGKQFLEKADGEAIHLILDEKFKSIELQETSNDEENITKILNDNIENDNKQIILQKELDEEEDDIVIQQTLF